MPVRESFTKYDACTIVKQLMMTYWSTSSTKAFLSSLGSHEYENGLAAVAIVVGFRFLYIGMR
ncbi:hypothetical protein COBT_001063, partial [Conglomerata obtusa]